MKKISAFIQYWLPVLVWMSFIFFLSSRHRTAITHDYVSDFLIFKSLHMIEYATLYFLLLRGFLSLNNETLSKGKKLVYPILIAILYATTDEFHQLFVPTREGTVRDIGIDTFGILLMYIYSRYNLRFIKKFI